MLVPTLAVPTVDWLLIAFRFQVARDPASGLLLQAAMADNLTMDAHLAALAIDYCARLYSTDGDFTRFRPFLRYANPLDV